MASTEEQPKITLYWLENSRAQRILWLLEELGLKYELKLYKRDPKTSFADPELEKVHPLGKSPVLEISTPDMEKPIVLAESSTILLYLCDHFDKGNKIMPRKWQEGKEGKVGGETAEWLRCQYIVQYCEGSLMPILLTTLIFSRLRGSAVPFFIRPISSAIAGRIFANFVFPNAKKHFGMLNSFLETPPSDGRYLCGGTLSAADIIMSYPLLAARDRIGDIGAWDGGSPEASFPKLYEYIARIEEEPGYKKSLDKIREIDDSFKAAPLKGDD